MLDLSDVIELCHFAGERFDLVQASGGNASMHDSDGTLWIKASGIAMGQVVSNEEIVGVNMERCLDLLGELSARSDDLSTAELDRRANECLSKARTQGSKKPSNETFLHCLLGPYTLHTHPIVVNSVVCRKGWQKKITPTFPDAIFIEYQTPGTRLSLALRRALIERNWKQGDPAVVFLANHGLLVAADSIIKVAELTNEVVTKLSYYLGVDFSHYRLSNLLSLLIQQATGDLLCAHYCEDSVLLNALRENPAALLAQPTVPDQAMHCGPAGMELHSLDDPQPIIDYVNKFGQYPKVVVYRASRSHLFIIGKDSRHSKDAQEVLKAHAMSLITAGTSKVEYLSDDELNYLLARSE